MAQSSVAVSGNGRKDPSFREVEAAEDNREVVHYITVPPPAGGGTCTCAVCHLVFQSRSTTWTTDRRQHTEDRYNGRYRSCRSGSP